MDSGNPPVPSRWQHLAGFTRDPVTPNAATQPNLATQDDPVIPASEWLPSEADQQTTPEHDEHQMPPTEAHSESGPPAEDLDITASEGADSQGLRRSQRTRRPPVRYPEPERKKSEAFSVECEALRMGDEADPLQDACHPLVYKASADPDTMYVDQALKASDRDKFIEAMEKEVSDHIAKGHWRMIPKSQVPPGTPILPSVWAMKRKRRIESREVYKWKARLNLHGGKQEYGVNFWETYSPVVTWASIRLLLILTILNGWCTKQIDFIQAYPQAPVECDLYMQVPRGFDVKGDPHSHVLKLRSNLYGQKQAGRVWNEYLKKGLFKIGFKQSQINDSVFYKGKVIFAVYVDDGILFGPREDELNSVISELTALKYDIEVVGDICDYLGIKISTLDDGRMELTQPHLIDAIIKDLGFLPNTKATCTPAISSKILNKDELGAPHDPNTFHYRSIVGKLNFLEKSTRPDIAYAVHQCARFSVDPRESHTRAIKHLIRYLKGTRDKGLILDPKDHSFDCWADADFAGNWNKLEAPTDVATARSRTGYTISYAGCPLVWASKLQVEIALSTTEAEYVSLSTSLREVIPLIQLMAEIKTQGHDIYSKEPRIHCKAFEDNSGALEIAKVHKMRPRTKHMNVKYHHFREYVRDGLIRLFSVRSQDQVADILTKPLPEEAFVRHRKSLMGW